MILLNDDFIKREKTSINLEDRGFQFGDGVYEVIRYYDKKTFKMEEHLKRLQRSAKNIRLQLPYSIEKIKNNLEKLMKESDIKSGNIYMQITRGVAARIHPFPKKAQPTLVAYVTPFKRPLDNMENGVKAHLTEDIRWNRCDIKSLNLLANVLAKQEAVDNESFESILHRNGIVTEGSSTNIFITKNNVIHTHPANNFILNGITRLEVIKLAKENNIEVKEETFTVEDLLKADEVFLTSTTSEVTPIIQVDDIIISDGIPGPITKKLIDLFEQLINAD